MLYTKRSQAIEPGKTADKSSEKQLGGLEPRSPFYRPTRPSNHLVTLPLDIQQH